MWRDASFLVGVLGTLYVLALVTDRGVKVDTLKANESRADLVTRESNTTQVF